MNKKVLIAGLVVVIIIVTVAGYVLHARQVSKLAVTHVVAVAPVGQVVDGFDKSLVIAHDALITDSRIVDMNDPISGRSETHSAYYTTQETAPDIFAAYQTYLKTNNYQIIKSITRGSATSTIYAYKKDALTLNINRVAASTTEVRVSVRTNYANQ